MRNYHTRGFAPQPRLHPESGTLPGIHRGHRQQPHPGGNSMIGIGRASARVAEKTEYHQQQQIIQRDFYDSDDEYSVYTAPQGFEDGAEFGSPKPSAYCSPSKRQRAIREVDHVLRSQQLTKASGEKSPRKSSPKKSSPRKSSPRTSSPRKSGPTAEKAAPAKPKPKINPIAARVDVVARAAFPFVFLVFKLCYWVYFSRKAIQDF